MFRYVSNGTTMNKMNVVFTAFHTGIQERERERKRERDRQTDRKTNIYIVHFIASRESADQNRCDMTGLGWRCAPSSSRTNPPTLAQNSAVSNGIRYIREAFWLVSSQGYNASRGCNKMSLNLKKKKKKNKTKKKNVNSYFKCACAANGLDV